MYYILESDYVGPNRDKHELETPTYYVSPTPGKTNLSHEERSDGWLGTTNDWYAAAHGEYETVDGVLGFFRKLGMTDEEAAELREALENEPPEKWLVYCPPKWEGSDEVAKICWSAYRPNLWDQEEKDEGLLYEDWDAVWGSLTEHPAAVNLAYSDHNGSDWLLPDELLSDPDIREAIRDKQYDDMYDDDEEPEFELLSVGLEVCEEIESILKERGWKTEILHADQFDTLTLLFYGVPPDDRITQAEAARRLNMDTRTIHQAIRDGRLKGYEDPGAPKRQGRTKISWAEVQELFTRSEAL